MSGEDTGRDGGRGEELGRGGFNGEKKKKPEGEKATQLEIKAFKKKQEREKGKEWESKMRNAFFFPFLHFPHSSFIPSFF